MIDDAEVWARVRAIYDGFLAGDNDGVDALLQRDVTIWDAAEFPLARGLGQLRDMRGRRPRDPGAPTVIQLDARDPVIDVWGKHWSGTSSSSNCQMAPARLSATRVSGGGPRVAGWPSTTMRTSLAGVARPERATTEDSRLAATAPSAHSDRLPALPDGRSFAQDG